MKKNISIEYNIEEIGCIDDYLVDNCVDLIKGSLKSFYGSVIFEANGSKIYIDSTQILHFMLSFISGLNELLIAVEEECVVEIPVIEIGYSLGLKLQDKNLFIFEFTQINKEPLLSCSYFEMYKEVYYRIKSLLLIIYDIKPELINLNILDRGILNAIRFNRYLDERKKLSTSPTIKIISVDNKPHE
ncbi:MAG: hypothetical protein KDF58_00020 [Alphaproteobacteria bacterium]|nr:hypothetical protein [Alphaproteobacteria bacterium]HPF46221.1 hypothetical protein [Emcibacteraceae bacterium]HRW29430.1 hypothetical protein [Emcibacteraceae bacterium]